MFTSNILLRNVYIMKWSAKGRRSKKREAKFMEELRTHADELAAGMNGTIFWDKPLIEARLG